MRRIILSKRASRRLEKLLEYLESEWSLKLKNEFVKKLDKSILQIKKYLDSSPGSEIVKVYTNISELGKQAQFLCTCFVSVN